MEEKYQAKYRREQDTKIKDEGKMDGEGRENKQNRK